MQAWIRQAAVRLNASYWLLPALLTLGAVLLSFLTYWLDVRIGSQWWAQLGWVEPSRPDGARALLSTIAGSMISVAGTVFAITIAAVVYASGNYGPRLLTDFMTDKGNQLSLGIFIADFVYCLLVLRTIRQPDEGGGTGFVPELSLIVAVALTLLSVAVLVYFLHHVPDSIRINRVVARIGRRAIADIESRYPDPDNGDPVPVARGEDCVPLRAGRVGYVEVIDFATLARACKEQGMKVHLAVRPGDFVHPDMTLLHLEGTAGEQAEDALRSAFAIGESRTAAQDIEYSIDELVEIALRALSPGINDPFTAVLCLHWLSAATALIAMRDLGHDPDGGDYGEAGVHALADDFTHFVSRGFGAVRASAAGSPIAARMFVQALESAAAGRPSDARAQVLREEARRLTEQAETALAGPSLEEVRAAARGFAGDG